MIKYKCPECKVANEENRWNEKTQERYGEAICDLNDFPDCNNSVFICPSCGKMVEREDIEEVEQGFDCCDYCEIERQNKHQNGYNFEDAKFCRMCGRGFERRVKHD